MQDVDSQEDEASASGAGQDQAGLPAVPISPQERQLLLSRLPTDVAPTLKAAVDSLNNTSDAQVNCNPSQHVAYTSCGFCLH